MKTGQIQAAEILYQLTELRPVEQTFEGEKQAGCAPQVEPDPESGPKLKRLKKQISNLIRHPLFEGYKLSSRDLMVIADLWNYHLEYPGRGSNWIFLCKSAGIPHYRVTECLEYVRGLLKRSIIRFEEKITGNYHLNPVILQASEYFLLLQIRSQTEIQPPGS